MLRPLLISTSLAACLVCAGCGVFETPPPAVAPPLATAPPYGVAPIVMAAPPCAPTYFAPGESCYCQPGGEVCGPCQAMPACPPAYGAPYYGSPYSGAPNTYGAPGATTAAPTTGWFDVLPQEGGAISPDFGLPTGPVVKNRLPNPLSVPVRDHNAAWDAIADVVSDYFPIQSEERVHQVGAVLTEGHVETPFQIASTVAEPWRDDSVGSYNRWQSTLQTVRRKALVRVEPTGAGYNVAVRVDKQLEDLPSPELATAGAAALRSDTSLPTDRLTPVDRTLVSDRWIPIGRDEPLEQEMLSRIKQRLGGA
ncbi:hypothetical protein Mal64_28970 [Pseudobythopirellula maris]|uniref:Uncharacterized protein n=2 Tax=Pseudobythopirellula maris TaxID=2527991 RepID=A0A5C5ZJJ3_9BACT|nr:hypothetical protein Mal64_28970 [Pseudobythopirellula maris]